MNIFCRNCLKGLFLLAVISSLMTSCELINPEEPAPSYIQVDTFVFDPGPTAGTMGPSPSSKIKDVWVYVDGDFQGTYELPAKFPVLKTGASTIYVTPGILLNGISNTHSPYPFYSGSEHEVTLTANGTTKINPTCNYLDVVECSYCEDFEGSGFSLANSPSSDTSMYQLPAGHPEIFEGSSSGVVYLDTANTFFEVSSTTSYLLPGSGKPVFIELDYKINQVMQVGLFVTLPGPNTEQIPVINLNPTEKWNKIYIQIGNFVTPLAPTATGFKIYMGAIKDPDVDKPVFYVDNIKVVNYE